MQSNARPDILFHDFCLIYISPRALTIKFSIAESHIVF